MLENFEISSIPSYLQEIIDRNDSLDCINIEPVNISFGKKKPPANERNSINQIGSRILPPLPEDSELQQLSTTIARLSKLASDNEKVLADLDSEIGRLEAEYYRLKYEKTLTELEALKSALSQGTGQKRVQPGGSKQISPRVQRSRMSSSLSKFPS